MMPLTTQTQDSVVTADMVAALIRQYPEAEPRIWRAVPMVQAGLVERTAQPGLFLVGSANDPDTAYQVDAYGCSCYDFQKRGGFCKHRAAVALFQQAERQDAEQSDPTPDEDAPSCPLHGDEECDWGCPGPSLDPLRVIVEPNPEDRYERTGRAYLALVPAAALPNPIGTCTQLPYTAAQRAIASELYDDLPQGAA